MKYDLATKLLRKSKGRHDDLIKAVAEKNLNQPGLMQAVVASIADGDPMLADYVTHIVLPCYKRAAVPLLTKAFNPNGKLADARRLVAIRRFDLSGARKLARAALNSAHQDLVIEAIRTLQGSKKDIALVLNQTKRRSSKIQRAAFEALRGVLDKKVVEEVTHYFSREVIEAVQAIQFTTHPHYTAHCVSALKSLGEQADATGTLSADKAKWLSYVFRACHGHGGIELDAALAAWVGRASSGFFTNDSGHSWGFWNESDLVDSVAMSVAPDAKRMLVAVRDSFRLTQMTAIMNAAAWHDDLDLVELFAPYIPRTNKPGRCRGWFCGCGGNWPCSLMSAVEFALDVDFEAPSYQGRKPHSMQLNLIDRIRKDPRWKVARRT